MGTFSVTLRITGPESAESESIDALVDTGATYTVLPGSLLRRLGVTAHTNAEFVLADGSVTRYDLGRAWVQLDGQREFTLVVFGDDAADPLLGAVTLEEFRLAPDPVAKELIPVRGLMKANRGWLEVVDADRRLGSG